MERVRMYDVKMLGDCSVIYGFIFATDITVRDFIAGYFEHKDDKSYMKNGTFYVKDNDCNFVGSCSFKDFNISENFSSEDVLDRIVTSATANGGWYDIHIDLNTKPAERKAKPVKCKLRKITNINR